MKEREANFELLRILSIMMIVMLHLLGKDHGNVLSKTQEFTAAWVVTWGIEALCTVAVNCYVMISGYYLIGSKESEDIDVNGEPVKPQWNKVLDICCTVWFYTIVLFVIAYAFGWISISKLSLLNLVTPITGRTYWFVSIYLGLYIMSPYMNKLIKCLTEAAYRRLIIVSMAMFSFLPTVLPVYDTFQTGRGTGIVWFSVLYLIAAYIRLYGIHGFCRKFEGWKTGHWTLIYLLLTMLILMSKVVISAVTMIILGYTAGTSILYQYYTPTCMFSALCLFMAFKEMKLSSDSIFGKIILRLAPLTFGVYIIHENPFINWKIWELVSPGVDVPVVVLVLELLVIVLVITIVCMAIEWIRQRGLLIIKYYTNRRA